MRVAEWWRAEISEGPCSGPTSPEPPLPQGFTKEETEMTTVMEARIYHVQPSHLLGRNAAGEIVYFASKGEVRDAKIGDTIFFNPEKPVMLSRGGVTWYGKNPRFLEFEPEPAKPDGRIK